ncbi:MAG: hypothetical protein PF572_00645 [Patescibacteria group bacterium]|jgi:hypothetical protein|nr:hypothetical protein [Patescibacteria group bacterium]
MFNKSISKFIDLAYSWWDYFTSEISSVFSFLYVKIYFVFFIAVNGINWLFSYYIFSNILPETRELIALHYNVEFGVNLIGNANNIFILPSLGLLIIVINFSLLLSIYKLKNSKFLGNFLLLPALISNVYLLIGLVSIYLANFK